MSHFERPEDKTSLAVAQAWTDAVAAGERGAIEALLSPDLVIWRNVTREAQNRADFIELALGLPQVLPGFHYAEVRRFPFDGGFVQQHVVTGNGPSGAPFEAPACIICHVRDGQITTMDEYYDSAHDPR